MNVSFSRGAKNLLLLFTALLILVAAVPAQAPSGSLRGQVTDPSGAAVANATVVVLPADGASSTATTNRDGIFEVKPLAPGNYTVQIFAQGFAPFELKSVTVSIASARSLNIKLSIQEQQEKVVVSDSTTSLDTAGGSNANHHDLALNRNVVPNLASNCGTI